MLRKIRFTPKKNKDEKDKLCINGNRERERAGKKIEEIRWWRELLKNLAPDWRSKNAEGVSVERVYLTFENGDTTEERKNKLKLNKKKKKEGKKETPLLLCLRITGGGKDITPYRFLIVKIFCLFKTKEKRK